MNDHPRICSQGFGCICPERAPDPIWPNPHRERTIRLDRILVAITFALAVLVLVGVVASAPR